MVQETGGFGENHRSLSNRPTQNPMGKPDIFSKYFAKIIVTYLLYLIYKISDQLEYFGFRPFCMVFSQTGS
jgi:hypothetical protein